jgi:hypothetical protein
VSEIVRDADESARIFVATREIQWQPDDPLLRVTEESHLISPLFRNGKRYSSSRFKGDQTRFLGTAMAISMHLQSRRVRRVTPNWDATAKSDQEKRLRRR